MKNKLFRIGLLVILLYFILKCLYIAKYIQLGVLPDEGAHLALIRAYISTSSIILDPNLLGAIPAGSISQDSFFYHFVLAKIALLFGLDGQDLFFFRIMGILISISNIMVFYRIAKLVFEDQVKILFAVVVFSNILMFTMTTCTIGYDVLVNLFSTVIIWKLLLLYKRPRLVDLIIIGIVSLLGIITKPSIYPFLALEIIVLGFVVYKHKLRLSMFKFLIKELKKTPLIAILFGFSFVFVICVMNKNYTSYGKFISLQCQDVFSYKDCTNENLNFKTYLNLKESNINRDRIFIVQYFDGWIDLILQRTFGVFSHRTMSVEIIEYGLLKACLYLGIFGFFLGYKNEENKLLFGVFLFYTLVILLYVNYSAYLVYGEISAGVHGRYLFPVLSCFSIILTSGFFYYSRFIRPQFILPFFVVAGFLFLDFPSFLLDKNIDLFLLNPEKVELVDFDKDIVNNRNSAQVHIDYFNGKLVKNASTFYYTNRSENISIEGWAFDNLNSDRLGGMLMSIENSNAFPIEYNIQRDDVAKAFKNRNLRLTGFRALLPISDTYRDTSLIDIICLDKMGKSRIGLRRIVLIKS